MKKQLFALAAAALVAPPGAFAEEGAGSALEPVEPEAGAWRVSVGFRAAPGIKTSASVDARAAAAAAGGALRAGRASSASAKTEVLGSTTDGTTEAEARASVAYDPDKMYYEFDTGFINLDDGADPLVPGETQNWHFKSADDFVDGAIRARTPYESVTTTRTRTTRTETSGRPSLREEWGDGLRGSSDETASGFELRLDRTVWEDAAFGLDVGLGYAWYDDVDCFSVRGRAYAASMKAAAPAGTRTTTTETTTTTKESGTVVTSIAQPEWQDPTDYVNGDGSMGGAVANVYEPALPDGYRMPVLTLSDANGSRFSTTTERTSFETSSGSTTTAGGPGAAAPSPSKTTRRTVDVRSKGSLSLQELRLGVRPFWKAAERLTLRADLGLFGTYSEFETETVLSVDGAPASVVRRRDEDDWTLGGYAGLELGVALTDELELSVGGELRFPHRSLRFDDGIVSGKAELAKWSVSAALGFRF